MPGFIINGQEEIPHDFTVVNYLDDPRLALKRGEDVHERSRPVVRIIGAHTTACFRTKVLPGIGPDRNVDLKVARVWAADGRKAGAHLTIDYDGSVGCHADLLLDHTLHGIFNKYSVGIEIAKRWTPKGGVYAYQLEVFVKVCEYLCKRFGIQRACVDPSMLNKQIKGRGDGRTIMGVVGHMHRTRHKPYDPGQPPFEMLVEAGFQPFKYDGDDRRFWKMRQQELNRVEAHDFDLTVDGLPFGDTRDAFRQVGYPDGLWREGPIGEVPE